MRFLLGLVGCGVLSAYGATVQCPNGGHVDAAPCIRASVANAQRAGDSQLVFPQGTYLVSGTITIPSKMQFVGNGRGDTGLTGTVLLAAPGFPVGAPLVEMGVPGNLNFGVRISNMTLNGAGRAGVALHNAWAMEQSYGSDLLLANFLNAGLVVESNGAQNSGPFSDLEIYSTTGTCVVVNNVTAFRGIDGATCNPSGYAARPAVGFQLNGAGTYLNLHAEHVTTGVRLGDNTPADGLVLQSVRTGPDVETGVLIDNAATSQNITLMGIQCAGCANDLVDRITGRQTPWDVGFYMLGNGAGDSKRVITSDQSMVQTY